MSTKSPSYQHYFMHCQKRRLLEKCPALHQTKPTEFAWPENQLLPHVLIYKRGEKFQGNHFTPNLWPIIFDPWTCNDTGRDPILLRHFNGAIYRKFTFQNYKGFSYSLGRLELLQANPGVPDDFLDRIHHQEEYPGTPGATGDQIKT